MNKKATFAKRQRETDLKEAAKRKEERRVERRNSRPAGQKGPAIDWGAATTVIPDGVAPEGAIPAPDPNADPTTTTTPPATDDTDNK
jgi:hypothetical protein